MTPNIVIPTERSDEGPPSGYSYLLRSDLVEILHCIQDDSENVQDGKKTTVIPTERSDEGPPSGYSYLLRSDLVEILHCVQDDS